MSEKTVFTGIFVSSNTLNDLSIFNGFVTVEHGKITKKGSKGEFQSLKKSGAFSKYEIVTLSNNQFMMPGLVDCHTHAPQFPNIGLGLDRPLLEWLDKYTFPLERRYSDVNFAASVYDKVVQRLLSNGTTTACYFGSLHLDGTLELVKSAMKFRQRALVGKVSMNMKNDAGYYNNTRTELADTQAFVETVLSYKNDLVLPVITPRFAISCDAELMSGLSKIARQRGCRVQCIMAHAIHLTEEEMQLLRKKSVSIAHCPASNTRLRSGLCPVRKYLDYGLTVGLGTDVSGGDSAFILDAMRRTMDVSTHLEIQGRQGASLNWKEALFLATLGGAKALQLDDKIGNFEIGKEFDALLIDVYSSGGQIDDYLTEAPSIEEHAVNLCQKFTYLGDDRNILQVYVKGINVKDNDNIPK